MIGPWKLDSSLPLHFPTVESVANLLRHADKGRPAALSVKTIGSANNNELEGLTYCGSEQNNVRFFQATADAVCPHVPLRLPVKQQQQSPTGQDVPSNAQDPPPALGFVAKSRLHSKEKAFFVSKFDLGVCS